MTEPGRGNEELNEVILRGLHDLQEPLDMVTRYVRFVEARYKGRLDSDANEFIDSAVDGVNRMRQIITHLLECLSNRSQHPFKS